MRKFEVCHADHTWGNHQWTSIDHRWDTPGGNAVRWWHASASCAYCIAIAPGRIPDICWAGVGSGVEVEIGFNIIIRVGVRVDVLRSASGSGSYKNSYNCSPGPMDFQLGCPMGRCGTLRNAEPALSKNGRKEALAWKSQSGVHHIKRRVSLSPLPYPAVIAKWIFRWVTGLSHPRFTAQRPSSVRSSAGCPPITLLWVWSKLTTCVLRWSYTT